ncbi:MAG: preprotein translocase subunit YajC [Alphaproteobacteria bacterium]
MLIAKAYAQAVDSLAELESQIPSIPDAPGAGELIFQNLIVVGVLILLFYVLLIMPQQRRFKEHTKMLNSLKKGDKIVTGGGLVGTVEKIIEDKDEVVIDLGDVKVTALRSTIQQKNDPRLAPKPELKDKDKAKSDDAKSEKTEKAKAKSEESEGKAAKSPSTKSSAAKTKKK